MKRMEKTEKAIGENTFYISPFAAFTAANISVELTAILSPMIGSMGSVVGELNAEEAAKSSIQSLTSGDSGAEDEGALQASDLMNMDVEKLLPALARAFGSLSGDKFERLMRRLLVDNQNISIQGAATDGRLVLLNKDLADEVFCGEIQDMLILCYEVIKVNFSGFFRKLGAQFGRQLRAMSSETATSGNMASLT